MEFARFTSLLKKQFRNLRFWKHNFTLRKSEMGRKSQTDHTGAKEPRMQHQQRQGGKPEGGVFYARCFDTLPYDPFDDSRTGRAAKPDKNKL
jgi:hypothetical protein